MVEASKFIPQGPKYPNTGYLGFYIRNRDSGFW